MKKILIHSLIFSPDGVSTAYLYNDIAVALRDAGYEVVVLTTTPHFNLVDEALRAQPLKWKIWGLLKQSDFKGIKVYHIPQKKFNSTILRLFGFLYWHIMSLIVGLCQTKVDLILSPSPPLTIGVINAWLGKLKRAKVVYNVQEIYPDILQLNEGIVRRALEKIEKYVYRKSDAVTTIDRVFYDTIKDRMEPSKLRIIPNFVDEDLYKPMDVTLSSILKLDGDEENALKVVYAGNIGYAQDWDILVRLAKRTLGLPVAYFVIGEGVQKSALEKAKEAQGLENLHILPYLPRHLMPEVISESDLQFIFMHPKMEHQGFPSKVYTVMSCGKPLMVSSAEGTPIVNFLKDLGCAKLSTSESAEQKVEEMAKWISSVSRDELTQMGLKGCHVIKENYGKNVVTKQYVQLVDDLLK